MSETYMERYLNKNIYKVSNPPGGASSISLGWDEPSNNFSQNRSSIIDNRPTNYQRQRNQMKNQSFVGQTQQRQYPKNPYPHKNPSLDYNDPKNNYNDSKHNSNSGQNISPFSYKKNYQQYLNPNFVQPRAIDYHNNEMSTYNWEQSSRFLEEELKYYQQKNKLLRSKVYGGYNADQTLKKYNGDFHQHSRRRRDQFDQPEELDLALKQRQKNRTYTLQF